MNPGPPLFSLFLGRGHTTRDVPPLQGSSCRRPESRGLRPWRQPWVRAMHPVRALKGRHGESPPIVDLNFHLDFYNHPVQS